jgi:hypothetical protein
MLPVKLHEASYDAQEVVTHLCNLLDNTHLHSLEITLILWMSGTVVHKQQNVPTLHTHGGSGHPVKMVTQQIFHTWFVCGNTASTL